MLTALAQDFSEGQRDSTPKVIGGSYGLGSKEFTPAMVARVFENLTEKKPLRDFTIGINDDVMHSSLAVTQSICLENPSTVRAIFYGLGSDGTVGANKNTIKIIGSEPELNAQGYFVYDSKKAGSQTISPLRFGPDEIKAPYLIESATFVACHQFHFLKNTNVLGSIEEWWSLFTQLSIQTSTSLE